MLNYPVYVNLHQSIRIFQFARAQLGTEGMEVKLLIVIALQKKVAVTLAKNLSRFMWECFGQSNTKDWARI